MYLKLGESATLLEQTLQEEIQADAKLTQIAEQKVNQEALRPRTRHAR
jgi:ferritin-like metal-binding protein YciE